MLLYFPLYFADASQVFQEAPNEHNYFNHYLILATNGTNLVELLMFVTMF